MQLAQCTFVADYRREVKAAAQASALGSSTPPARCVAVPLWVGHRSLRPLRDASFLLLDACCMHAASLDASGESVAVLVGLMLGSRHFSLDAGGRKLYSQ